MRRKRSGRRSAAQWSRLLADWDRQSESAETFAKRLGVTCGTLAWWSWRVKVPSVAPAAQAQDTPHFVRVEVADETLPASAPEDWSLTSPTGHTLFVRGPIDLSLLGLVLEHMLPREAR